MIELPAVPRFALLAAAMIVLAGLDFGGALLAKQWADNGSRLCFLIGLGLFVVLFAVYATSLKTAELSVVTMGWVVLLQVGLVLIDRLHYNVSISVEKWAVIACHLVVADLFDSRSIRGQRLVSADMGASALEAFIFPEPTPIRPALVTSQRSAPMLDALQEHLDAGTIAFSTPGHKGGRLVDDQLRTLLGEPVFHSDVWLNTARHDHALRAAEQLAAETWGADDAWYVVNGSSSGNHALLLALVQPGDTVIVARDAHMSVLTGLILVGANPVFVAPDLHPSLAHERGRRSRAHRGSARRAS